jgi:hypothetical protein
MQLDRSPSYRANLLTVNVTLSHRPFVKGAGGMLKVINDSLATPHGQSYHNHTPPSTTKCKIQRLSSTNNPNNKKNNRLI